MVNNGRGEAKRMVTDRTADEHLRDVHSDEH